MSRQYSYDHADRISGVSGFNPGVLPPFSGSYGYDAFGNMSSRSGNYALNQTVSDSATFTNDRRNGWTYDEDGRVKLSPDPTTGGTRSWTYDAAGNTTFVSETAPGTTATNTLVYDGDDELLKDTVVNNSSTTSNYLINSTVLGKVLVKLDASGNKNTTYVPLNSLATALEQKDFQGNPTIGWVRRDASGLQENDRAADPFGNLINNVQPPVVGPPPIVPFYGPGYMNPSNAAFTNANNYAMSCVLDGVTAPCTEVMRAVNGGTVDPNSIRLSTTGGLADFGNAGLAGLVLDLNNSRRVWTEDKVVQSTPPKLRRPGAPRTPTTDDPRGGEASGHWDKYYEISAFFIAAFLQEPSQSTDTRTSCQRFADIVDQIATNNPHIIASDFVERLYRRFANLRNEFSSDGFKTQFQDFGGSADQARHYIGGLNAGFIATQWGSETVGRWVANAREYDFMVTMDTAIPLVYSVQNDSQRADQRLNAVSTRHGAALSNGEIKPFQLADKIRREVCQ